MKIAEIYCSRQGEGFLTGTESIFVRASGCNLRCSFCDTPFTSWSPEGEDLSVAEIFEQMQQWPAQHVVITGGEPMLFAELLPLTTALRQAGKHITIETAGTLFLPVACDLMSISPKLANSTPSPERDAHWSSRHEQSRDVPDVIRHLVKEYAYQVKFVVDSPNDLPEIESYLQRFPEIARERVLLMPQGTEPDELAARKTWLEPVCYERGFTYCPRMHIKWYGHRRGT